MNILDYNSLMSSFSDLLPAVSCDTGRKASADLNDDGAVNQFDYNLFMREMLNQGGGGNYTLGRSSSFLKLTLLLLIF